MNRIRIIVLSVVAVCAIWVSSAAAADFTPERGICEHVEKGAVYKTSSCEEAGAGGHKGYVWVPNKKGSSFSGTTGEMILRTITPEETELDVKSCAKGKVTGKLVGPTKSTSQFTLEECEAGGEKCKSAGAAPGTIKTFELEGTLGTVNDATDEVGEDLTGNGPEGLIAKFECGANAWELRGSLIGKVKPVDALSSKLSTLTFVEAGDKQQPEKFEGEPKVTLEAEINGLGSGSFPFRMVVEGTGTNNGPRLQIRA